MHHPAGVTRLRYSLIPGPTRKKERRTLCRRAAGIDKRRDASPNPRGHRHPRSEGADTASGSFISAGTCFYWLHTHAADGIIHIESPVQRTYTLGDFFDEWGQPLGRGHVGPAAGKVTAIYDGKVYLGNLVTSRSPRMLRSS